MLLFDEASSILQDLQAIIASLFVSIDWDIIFFVGIAFQILFAVFYLIKSRFSYEVRVVKKLLRLNNWLNKNRYIDQNNLIEFNNMMKHTPKHLRYYWHEYMLNREKEPSHYMSTYNLVEKPLKSSSYLANIKNFKTTTIIMAGVLLLFSVLKLSTITPTLGDIGLCLITPLLMLLLYGILSIVMRASQNMNVNSLYQYVHYFGRFLDRAVTTMPEYVDFEVLFTSREIKKGIPVLNEYLEKRARQEQEELEKARVNAVEHETYDFSSTGINGSLVLERAINESETYINIRSRLLSEIQQLDDEIESIKRTYENTEKDYQKKMQVSKENVDRLRKQQEETTNRIENNYIKKQQADEIKKQEQLEKDHDAATIRFNQEMETLTKEIATRRTELEERRKYVEEAMKAEYQTFSTKLYKSLETILKEENQDEREELLEIKDEIAESLQQANDVIAQKDREILELYQILEAHGIDVNQYAGYSSESLRREAKKKKSGKKAKPEVQAVESAPVQNPQVAAIAPVANFANDPNLIPLAQIPEEEKQYGEDGGFYDKNGYYRYANGTYFTPNSEFHDEFGGWFEADGVTYHPPGEQPLVEAQPQPEEEVQEAEQVQQPAQTLRMDTIPEEEREYSEDGGFFDKEGYYYYPNGTYFTPDGRFFDEHGGWFEPDGVTYHSPDEDDEDDDFPQPKMFKEDSKDSIVLKKLNDADVDEKESQKPALSQDALKEIEKLRQQFNIEVEKDKKRAKQEEKPEDAPQPDSEEKSQPQEQPKEEPQAAQAEQTKPVQEAQEPAPEDLFEQPAQEANDLFEQPKPEEPAPEQAPAKRRGRPRKNPETNQPKQPSGRGRGRPRKEPIAQQPVAPVEDSLFEQPAQDLFESPVQLFEVPAEEAPMAQESKPASRGRGRPRKTPATEQPKQPSGRGRGRPKKSVEALAQPQPSRGRGRPSKSVANQKIAGEFADLMAPVQNPELDELDKLNAKIEDENKRLAKQQEQLDQQLTQTLFQLSGDDENK